MEPNEDCCTENDTLRCHDRMARVWVTMNNMNNDLGERVDDLGERVEQQQRNLLFLILCVYFAYVWHALTRSDHAAYVCHALTGSDHASSRS